jgi:hypothetical protein
MEINSLKNHPSDRQRPISIYGKARRILFFGFEKPYLQTTLVIISRLAIQFSTVL